MELKSAGVEREVCRLLREYEALSSSLVSSFDWDALAQARRLDPAVRLSVLAARSTDAMLETAARLGAVSVNPRVNLVTGALVARAHRGGFKVLVWTVDNGANIDRMIALGVDGIMTNYPARLALRLSAAEY